MRFSSTLRSTAFMAMACLLGAGRPATAAPMTFQVNGVIDVVPMTFSSTFSVGDPFSILYTFETTTAARVGSNSNFAVFDALTSFSLSIGASYSGASTAAAEIQVDNDPGAPFHDRYAVLSRTIEGLTTPPVGGIDVLFAGFRLDDSTDTVFSDALTLPTTISLSSFDSDRFFLFFANGESVEGDVQSINAVPEPTSAALLGMGLIGLCGARYRRRKRIPATT